MTKSLLTLLAVALASASFAGQRADAQVSPILPTDVTGPTAGGLGPAGILNNLGVYGGSFAQPSVSGQVLTMPAVLPGGVIYSAPAQVPMWYGRRYRSFMDYSSYPSLDYGTDQFIITP